MAEVVQIPSLLADYRLIEETYRGPATAAWRAEHLATGLAARVAIVVPPPRASREAIEAITTGFRRAVERAGAFSSPDLLPYDGAAEHEGLPCAITLLPEGTFLSDAMALEEPVSVARVMQIGSVIGHTLARLHDAGLWHGYLHPANILLVGDERPALLDPMVHAAAAAAAWQAGLAVSGSPYVGVGERAFREQDPHVDVYALASILLRILTGRSPERLLMEQIEKTLPQALPTSLRQDLMAALNIGSGSRPPTARTLAVHLSFDVAWLRATAELGPTRESAPSSDGAAAASAATVREETPESPPPTVERPRPLPTAEPAGVGDAPAERAPVTTAPGAGAAWSTRSVLPHEAPASTAGPRVPPDPPRAYAAFYGAPHAPIYAGRWTRRSAFAAVVGLLLITLPLGILIGRYVRPATPPLRAGGGAATVAADGQALGRRETLVYEVQLGPYPDRASATDVQRSIARHWPNAWVILSQDQAFVQVLSSLYADKAERLAERFREQGYQARIRQTTRPYSP
jgi:hypothetical protein